MALAAPTNLTAEVLSSTQILLTWDEVPTATLHRVYKNGAIVDIANGSWVDNSFNPMAVTTYEVRAVLISFTGTQFEPEPNVEVGPAATLIIGDETGETDVPTAPETLAVPQALAVSQTGLNEATLTWELLTPATNIDIEIDGVVTNIAADVTYVDSGIPDNATRTYRIRAVNTTADPDITSDYTDPVEITIVPLGVPDPNVTIESSTRIIVDWAAIPGATSYDIEIDGAVTSLGDFPAALDAQLAPQQTRTYRVRAVSDGFEGAWSSPVTGTTFRTIDLSVTAVSGRRSYFPSDQQIFATALEAEFNNIYALLEGATVTPPDEEPVPPEEDMPGILTLTAARDDTPFESVVSIEWTSEAFPSDVSAARRFFQLQILGAGGVVLFDGGLSGATAPFSTSVPGLPTDEFLTVRVRAVVDSISDPTRVGDWTSASVPAAVSVPAEPEWLGAETSQGADGTSHEFDLPAGAAIDDHILVIAFVAPTDSPGGFVSGTALATPPAGWTARVESSTNIGTGWPVFKTFQPIVMLKKLESGFSTSETMTTPFNASVAFHVHSFRGMSGDLLNSYVLDTYSPVFASTERTFDSIALTKPELSGSGEAFRFGGFALGDGTSLISPPSAVTKFAMTIDGTAALTTFSFVDLFTLPDDLVFITEWSSRFTPNQAYTGVAQVPYTFGYTGGTTP